MIMMPGTMNDSAQLCSTNAPATTEPAMLPTDVWLFHSPITRPRLPNTQRQQVCVQPCPAAINVTLPAYAAECCAAKPLMLGAWCPQLSIDISCPHGTQQQTRCMLLL